MRLLMMRLFCAQVAALCPRQLLKAKRWELQTLKPGRQSKASKLMDEDGDARLDQIEELDHVGVG